MDKIFGFDIYTIIISYFNDFNDILIICAVCKSMRRHKYIEKIQFTKVLFIDNRKIPILNANLVEIHNVKPGDISLRHILHYSNLKKITLTNGIIDKYICDILLESIIQTITLQDVRIDELPIIPTLESLKIVNCIPMQCKFTHNYTNLKALYLFNHGFRFTAVYITYFPNLEFLYVDDDTNCVKYSISESNSISFNLSNLTNLVYLNYNKLLINYESLAKLTNLEYLSVNILPNIHYLPIMSSIKYLSISSIDYPDNQYKLIFPNLRYIIYTGHLYDIRLYSLTRKLNIISHINEKHSEIRSKYNNIYFTWQSNYFNTYPSNTST